MRQLVGCSIVVACVVVTVGSLIFVFSRVGRKLDKQSQMYVDEVLPKIVSDWQANQLIKRASPELLKATPDNKIRSLFSAFSKRLGNLKNYKGSRGEANIFFRFPEGRTVTATYVCDANFERGPASIQIRIILRNKTWQILELHVRSEALL